MLPTTARLIHCWVLALFLALAGMARAASGVGAPPIGAFFDNSAFSGALLSPNARFLAVRIGAKDKRDGLAVINLETHAGQLVARFDDADIGYFQWVNDERLVFTAGDKQRGQRDQEFAPGLYAINRDGKNMMQLAERRGVDFVSERAPGAARKMLPWNTFPLSQRGAQDSEYIYVENPEYSEDTGELRHVNLLRLNTLTGRSQVVERPAAAQDWLLDQKGEPRIAFAVERERETVHYRDPTTSQWRKLSSSNRYTGEAKVGAFAPLGFAPDGTLFVTSNASGDQSALHTFDFTTNAVSAAPAFATAGYDFNGTLLMDNKELLGVRFVSDRTSTHWISARMKALQSLIDQLRPATINTVSIGARAETPWVLVESTSDVQPASYALFNTLTQRFDKVGDAHPAIDPDRMGHQRTLRYKARDGLGIPARLTLPGVGDGKNLPLVVLVHGGPFVRGGAWGWNPDAQFLASRGYAVLEPEYRGSTGFGFGHFRAGWKQWGLKMQDDIADGAKWAITEGVADPARICIAGASYGGYATLMGLINNPELFKCGIDWVGVTDIKLLYTGHWSAKSDFSEGYKKYGMPDLVGDPVKDAAQFEATSPLAQAARIKQPLLLAYGGADQRVPVYHGKKFYEAVKRTNADVEWVVYDEEGHGWSLPRNRIDFWGRVEKFLEKNIGPR
jgi:dipeptidyl aminopeptidase/acylaminoacyl peptidase